MTRQIRIVKYRTRKIWKNIKKWLEKIQPKYTIFSAGYHNMYHLPNIQVVKAYRKAHSQVYNTAMSGAVRIELTKKGIKSISTAKQQKDFFWQYLKFN